MVHCEYSPSNPKVERAVGEGDKRVNFITKAPRCQPLEGYYLLPWEISESLPKVITNILHWCCAQEYQSHQGSTPINSSKWMGGKNWVQPCFQTRTPTGKKIVRQREASSGEDEWGEKASGRDRRQNTDKSWHPCVTNHREESWDSISNLWKTYSGCNFMR